MSTHNFYSSILGSVIGTILTHPLDTLKTNFQVSKYSLLKTFNDFNKQNKGKLIKNYYRGLKLPLLAIPLEKGFVFNLDNYLYDKYNNRFLSGSISGVNAGILVNIIENIKLNQQIKRNIKNISKVSLLTKGLPLTMFREGLGYGIYFYSYHNYYHKSLNSFLAGGLSGLTAWVLIYPFDRIKTLIQTGHKMNIQWNTLYHGSSISFIRAFLFHGLVFQLYESFNLYLI